MDGSNMAVSSSNCIFLDGRSRMWPGERTLVAVDREFCYIWHGSGMPDRMRCSVRMNSEPGTELRDAKAVTRKQRREYGHRKVAVWYS